MGYTSGLPYVTISRPLRKETAPMLLEISRALVGVSHLCKFRGNHEPINTVRGIGGLF